MVIDLKQDMFVVLLEQTPSERQRVQRTLEQIVYELLENGRFVGASPCCGGVCDFFYRRLAA
jgi:hypothetical protein